MIFSNVLRLRKHPAPDVIAPGCGSRAVFHASSAANPVSSLIVGIGDGRRGPARASTAIAFSSQAVEVIIGQGCSAFPCISLRSKVTKGIIDI